MGDALSHGIQTKMGRRYLLDKSASARIGYASWRDVSLATLDAHAGKLSEVEASRARHVVTETARTIAAAQALRDGNWNTLGHLMYDSHQSLRHDFQVSCPELDLLVQIAQELGDACGVIGSRMTGGGFGGCTVTLVRTSQAEHVSAELNRRYVQRRGIEASSFITRPARGAHRLDPIPLDD